MDRHSNRHPRGMCLAACLTALSLALGAAACGDSDDDGGGGAGGPEATRADSATSPAPSGKRDRGPVLAGDREQARQSADAVDRVYEDLGAAADAGVAAINVPIGRTLAVAEDDAGVAGMCDLMSEAAKRQTIDFAKRSSGVAGVDWTCEKATALLLRRSRHTGGLKPSLQAEVLRVDADGDRATATVRFGGKRGRSRQIALVKEDGKWKLAATPRRGG